MVAVFDTQGTSQWNKATPLYRSKQDTPPSGPKSFSTETGFTHTDYVKSFSNLEIISSRQIHCPTDPA